ncbi:BspA family leucine-rich repeat surface protein [Aquiflexum sp.]|uniref:BspA family leucine-rich repeat surface protein n=1 Tax=Aquiflexum sp. TaxID=1872584 RepID=UPI0035932D49
MKALKLNYLFSIVLAGLVLACDKTDPEPTPTFSVSITASPAEGGNITISPAIGSYDQGQTVTLTAQANTNWVFKEWDGDASGNANPLSIAMNSNKSVTGVFVKRDYPLNITIVGEGTVTEVIVTNPSGREYPHGTTVELTPVPKEGWKFDSWEGDLSGSEVPQRISVDGVKNVTVKFICDEDDDPRFYLAENGITCKCEGVNPGDKGFLNGVEFEAVDNALLRQRRDQNADMTKLCTSLVTDMSSLFFSLNFNQPIGNWDVSKVIDMLWMFNNSTFNQPIENWDVSNVINMQGMFANSSFNHPIGYWNVSNATDISLMFYNSSFNQPIGNWDVSKVTNMSSMFSSGWPNIHPFNQEIGLWDVSNVTDISNMFSNSNFNQHIGNWNVSKVANMSGMFSSNNADHFSPFNHDLGSWEVGNVEDMTAMFYRSLFNSPIGDWNVSKVKNMAGMFGGSAIFNQPIGNWDVSNVTDMSQMFEENKFFNQPIGEWDVSKVELMIGMFFGSSFNQPIGNWNVGNVVEMWYMFGAWDDEIPEIQFNQPIGEWDVSNVTNMGGMFLYNEHFNQDLSKWCVDEFSAEPEDFSAGTTAWVLPKPVWGTCPD